ncbi:hypothetical protein PMAYCL1PPCAC_23341 [Pristionchus mayeri]|uniref:EamA domain-containing protein n=1 Tax=Pristionchus mayeri TaxID=1317129 RepID=A0AAN5I7C9_9BILA|nr:hypothetical protein PMAYCL1PPCAC_23341 [Pristionchus mayeri]
MSESASSNILSLWPALVVAVAWGATNPFLRRGVKDSERCPSVLSLDVHPFLRPLVQLLNLILNWRVFVPLAINQSASILFVAVSAAYPISVVVPLVNSLQLVVTTVVGSMLGERLTRKSLLGVILIGAGITCMLIDDNSSH